jgi:hypothetical protein
VTRPDVTVGGWSWSPSIGLYYGSGPAGQREQVHQPLMTSPWVVVASEYQAALPDDRTDAPGRGTFVSIFSDYQSAMEYVAQNPEVGR